eukprot:TRINITY_DN35147_c0_g1_i1.p1 TRINITY_DN35147_c0_g1~~TRINITY_DN35147_c0_g1_i1.p1  ORF type:complete len:597 (+),score=59.37 TRINITY_DN35147_c0_g1_i1:239-2029(+)
MGPPLPSAIEEHYDYLVIGALGVCLCGQTAVMHWSYWLLKAAGFLRWCVACFCCLWHRDEGQDADGGESEEYMEMLIEWNFSFVRGTIAAILAFSAYASVPILVNIIGRGNRTWTVIHDCTFVTLWVFMLALKAYTDRLGTRTDRAAVTRVTAIYYASLLVTSALFLAATPAEHMFFYDIGMTFIRMACSACIMRRKWILAGSMTFSSIVLCQPLLMGDGRSNYSFTFPVASQLGGGVLCLVASEVAHRFMAMLVTSTYEAQVMRKASERMLDVLCDAVVHLDSDLRLTAPATKLAAILGNTEQDLTHASLEDFLDDDCKDNLKDFMTSMDRRADSSFGAMNVRLLDSTGSLLQFQAFFINFKGIGKGERAFILGFQELGKDSVAATATRTLPAEMPPDSAQDAADEAHQARVVVLPPSLQDACPRRPRPLARAPSVIGRSEVSSYTTGPDRRASLPADHRLRTIWKVIHEKLIDLAKSVNHEYAVEDTCCLYHSYVDMLSEHIRRLRSAACQSAFSLHDAWQCEACGILAREVPADGCMCPACGCTALESEEVLRQAQESLTSDLPDAKGQSELQFVSDSATPEALTSGCSHICL